MRPVLSLILAISTLGLSSVARAQSPTQSPAPVDRTLFSFPGSMVGPFSAASASMALADRWLGDEPAGNAAARFAPTLSISPVLLHSSRQDLRADFRSFNETAAFLDGAGAWLGAPWGRTAFMAYAVQPTVRLEENAFEGGERGGPAPPAEFKTSSSAREIRFGAGASWRFGRVRLGGAYEWTRRQDEYHVVQGAGSPQSGTRSLGFEGTGAGFQAGVRLEPNDRFTLGAGLRRLPGLDLKGAQRWTLLVGDSLLTFGAEREPAWEFGVSGRWAASQGFRVLAMATRATEQSWRGLGVTSDETTLWSVAGEYQVPESPWQVRFGFGRQTQTGAPEHRSTLFGAGFGWREPGYGLDVGILRRSLERVGHPNSFDDRLVGSVTLFR